VTTTLERVGNALKDVRSDTVGDRETVCCLHYTGTCLQRRADGGQGLMTERAKTTVSLVLAAKP
jgi:hypothetical protein